MKINKNRDVEYLKKFLRTFLDGHSEEFNAESKGYRIFNALMFNIHPSKTFPEEAITETRIGQIYKKEKELIINSLKRDLESLDQYKKEKELCKDEVIKHVHTARQYIVVLSHVDRLQGIVSKVKYEPKKTKLVKTLELTIEELNLSVTLTKTLLRANILTLDSIISKTPEELMQLRRFTKRNLVEVEEVVSTNNLFLGIK